MTSLTRLPGWRGRLAALVTDWAARPFAPGQTDCVLFAFAAIHSVTGVDHAAAYRGAYTTMEEGRALLKARVGVTPLQHIRGILPRIQRTRALPGDIAVLPSRGPSAGAFAVVQGPRLLLVSEEGLVTQPRDAGSAYFGVGHD